MHRRKKIVIILCFIIGVLSGCSYERTFFPSTELENYNKPVVFLRSEKDEETYFIMLENPEQKYYLNYSHIWDFNPKKQTFLFCEEKDGKESICEYNLSQQKYEYLLDGNSVCEYLNLSQVEQFQSVYYYTEDETISFVYGDYLVIYDMQGEFLLKMQLSLAQTDRIYGWLNSQTLLMSCFRTVYEFNIESKERTEIKSELGVGIILSPDKTMGCSCGDENWFGASFNPILVWDTSSYDVKKFHEGVTSGARVQLSNDYQYAMYAQGRIGENDDSQLLCINVKNGDVCVIYETEDIIHDILWW
ncbi:MAG: hypothetical protein HDR23_06790 [Lachnospiraceae bacterium]|nr:hypothetical protein [Lachnospiraceae bacterium]